VQDFDESVLLHKARVITISSAKKILITFSGSLLPKNSISFLL